MPPSHHHSPRSPAAFRYTSPVMIDVTETSVDASQPADAGSGEAAKALRKRRWRRIKWTVRLALLLIIVGFFIVGFDGLFYYPSRTIQYTPDEFSYSYEEVTFATSDGVKLCGWFLPATGTPRGTVLHFHGNAENIGTHFFVSVWLVSQGYNLFEFDYRGYGKSEGEVTRAGTIRDGHAALDYLLSRPDVDPERIVAFGQSLGGAVATVVSAEREEIRAVVLDSTFSGYRRIGSMHLQKLLRWKWLCDQIARAGLADDYNPIDYVERIAPRPLLIVASKEDRICYAEGGRELYEAAGEPKEFMLVDQSHHLSTVADNIDGVQGRIVDLFDRALGDGK